MSDIFDDLSNAARRLAGNVSTEVSVAALEQKVADAYRGLGRMYFEAAQRGERCEGPAFDKHVAEIASLLEQIRQKRYNKG
ncbi:MAG: hypothetical protein IIV61_03935 [Oscillospiraceae bacterium]|jgi:hypothetical protein|nr:hypothetical protein [Oscillospiraceae bacterium]